MGRIPGRAAVAPGGTSVSCHPGVVRVSSPAAFASPGARWQTFVERVGRLPEVDVVEIDRRRGTAAVFYSPRDVKLDQLLERMAAVLAAPPENSSPAGLQNAHSSLADRTHVRLFRRGSRLSTWEIVHDTPGRLRVRDRELRSSPATAQRIGMELGACPGVRDVTVRPLTGSVLIRYDAEVADRQVILARLDDLVRDGGLVRCESLPSRSRWVFAHVTLGLAAAGVLIYPPLLPASAALLVASNLSTFRDAWRQIRRRQAGLPVLQTAIVGATLATGGYLAASLMNWLLVYWEDRQARLTAAGCQMLSGTVRLRPTSSAWVVRDGVELETPLAHLQPGDVVTVRAGETIPVDGRIVSGTAVLDESSLHGPFGLVFRTAGGGVYEGSQLVEGDLRIEVLRAGAATVATKIGRTLTAAAANPSNGARLSPPQFAERAVPPVLMTAGVGLLLGDATVAAAVLRPDYATGPELGDSVTLIDRLGSCFDRGIVIRRPEVFNRIAAADVVVFDHDRILEACRLDVERVHVAGGYSAADVLAYAACGTRDFHDPRAGAVRAACTAYGGDRLDLALTCRTEGVDFVHGNRAIRVAGLERGGDTPLSAPLFVFSNGELAGSVTFCEGTAPAAADAIRELRTRCSMTVELLSSAHAAEAERLAAALGVDDLHLCPSDEAKEAVLRRLSSQGRQVVYVGDCRKNPRAAEAARVAVFPCPDPAWESDPSGVWLLAPHFEKLAELRETAVAMCDQAERHCHLILIPNMVCIAGAFLFGFTSLAVVVLSNLGTYSVYSQSRAALRRTERRLLDRRRTRWIAASRPAPSVQALALPQGPQ